MVQVQQVAVEMEERNRPVAADILNFIDGQFVKGGSGTTFPNIDPATGRETGRVHEATREDVDRAVAAAKRALTGPWGKMTTAERIRLIIRAPLDRLQDMVAASWSITTCFPIPSDITATSGPQRFKRAIVIESASG